MQAALTGQGKLCVDALGMEGMSGRKYRLFINNLIEALLEQGVALNIVLPFAIDDFVEQLVRPAGEAWVTRFEACLASAKTVRFATEDAYLGDDQLFPYSSSLAMGLASLCARHLHAPLLQLAVWDGVVDDGADALGRRVGRRRRGPAGRGIPVVRADRPGAGSAATAGGRAQQRPDRRRAVYQPQHSRRARQQHLAQAGGFRPGAGRRPG